MSAEVFDALVIGAGFGGLGAALTLAEAGARVCLCEALRYPGGCASTFTKLGARFDAGATLMSGLGEDQLFGRWRARYAPELELDWMPDVIDFRAPGLRLSMGRSREALVEAFCALPGAPIEGVRGFFARQRRVADALWPLFDDPSLLPPFDLRALLRHATRSGAYARLAPLVGKPLGAVLAAEGLDDFAPLRLWADALCQITVQCSSAEAEATFALAALDYVHRGTAHVRGGVGALAEGLLAGARGLGVDVRMSNRVSGLARESDGVWAASTRRGVIRARRVLGNLLPSALAQLLPAGTRLPPRVSELQASVSDGWGAVMLYAVARPPEDAPRHAHHVQIVDDPSAPLVDGNHVFLSIGGANEVERAPAGRRTITASTHVALGALRGSPEDARRAVEAIQARMRATIARGAPAWAERIEASLTASPRTFARFVGRPEGAVGGIPRRAGLHNYRGMSPLEVAPGLWLVGDTAFPGQSALATAVGGVRAAAAALRS